jgi:hypothetical protein
MPAGSARRGGWLGAAPGLRRRDGSGARSWPGSRPRRRPGGESPRPWRRTLAAPRLATPPQPARPARRKSSPARSRPAGKPRRGLAVAPGRSATRAGPRRGSRGGAAPTRREDRGRGRTGPATPGADPNARVLRRGPVARPSAGCAGASRDDVSRPGAARRSRPRAALGWRLVPAPLLAPAEPLPFLGGTAAERGARRPRADCGSRPAGPGFGLRARRGAGSATP